MLMKFIGMSQLSPSSTVLLQDRFLSYCDRLQWNSEVHHGVSSLLKQGDSYVNACKFNIQSPMKNIGIDFEKSSTTRANR